jgi:hypothetical protein
LKKNRAEVLIPPDLKTALEVIFKVRKVNAETNWDVIDMNQMRDGGNSSTNDNIGDRNGEFSYILEIEAVIITDACR